MTAILVAMLSVAAKNAFGVLSTIAMARGRALISGGLDVGYEAAFIFTAAFGAGPVIKNGLTPHSLAVIAAILATAFVTATVSTRFGNKMRSENEHDSDNNQERFDYIVVAAGTTGSVLAARLSQDPCCRVLLVEEQEPREVRR